DVHEVLVRRERSGGRRAHLELAGCEVAGPGEQMRRGVAFAVTFLAVALRAVMKVELLARLPLRLGPEVGTLRAHQLHRRGTQQRDQDSDTPARYQARGHLCSTSSFARGFCPVKS